MRLLPADLAHYLGELAMRAPIWGLTDAFYDSRLSVNLAGVKLNNPLVAAAGIDKDCRAVKNILRVGFGGAVGGTVTPHKRAGNPKTRIVRLSAQKALVNSMGFPNKGAAAVGARLKRHANAKQRIIMSVADETVDGFLQTAATLAPNCAGIELNISSPNTKGLARFHDPSALNELLSAVVKANQKRLAVFVKLPRLSQIADTTRLARVAADNGVDGLVAANSRPVKDERLAVGSGGLSGQPLYETTLEATRALSAEFGASVNVIACGGVSTARQVWELLASGARAVQIYTALIYRGPTLPNRINRELARALDATGLKTIGEINADCAWPFAD